MKKNASPVVFKKCGRAFELSPEQAEFIRTGRLSPESEALVQAEIERVSKLVAEEDDIEEIDDDFDCEDDD